MQFNLKRILKALLFSTSEPLTIRDIQAVITRYHAQAEDEPEEAQERFLEQDNGSGEPAVSAIDGDQSIMEAIFDQVPSLLTATQIRDAMDAIALELEEANEVYRLHQGPAGYRLTTARDFADWVRLLRNEAKPARLSRAALETLAIIAYRQPVTRAEMEAIRGVSVDGGISKLLDLDLIFVTGRADLPGRPIQYGTTEKFLEFIGVRSIEELPASDVLSPSQITEWIRQATQEEPVTDSDVGLPDGENDDRQAMLEEAVTDAPSADSVENARAEQADEDGDAQPQEGEAQLAAEQDGIEESPDAATEQDDDALKAVEDESKNGWN